MLQQGEIKPNRRDADSGAGLMWLLTLTGRQGRLTTLALMKVQSLGRWTSGDVQARAPHHLIRGRQLGTEQREPSDCEIAAMMRHKERSKELTEKVQMVVYNVVESLSLPRQGLGTQIQSSFKSEKQALMSMKEEMQVGNKDKLESRVLHRAMKASSRDRH